MRASQRMQTAAVAGARELLQQPDAAEVHQCQQLGGISVGGWIVLGVVIGFCCGIVSTLCLQYYRRRKEERYLKQVPLTPPGRSLGYSRQLSQQPSAADVGGLANPGHRPPGVAAPASLRSTPSQPPKVYGPLTKSIAAVPGSILAMSDSIRNGIHHNEASAGDVGLGYNDQCLPADLHGHVLSAAQGPLTGSYVALPQQAPRLSAVNHGDVPSSQPLQGFNSAVYGPGSQVPRPIPAVSPDSSDISDFEALHQQHLPTSILHSSMPECLPSPTAATHHELYPGPRLLASQTSSQPLPGAPGTATSSAADKTPNISSKAEQSAGEKQATPTSAGSSALEVDEAYEDHELDDDWRRLLGDVDSRLIAQKQKAMDARERSVAIKKLLVATGTRGVDFAMNAALQAVLEFRRFHGK